MLWLRISCVTLLSINTGCHVLMPLDSHEATDLSDLVQPGLDLGTAVDRSATEDLAVHEGPINPDIGLNPDISPANDNGGAGPCAAGATAEKPPTGWSGNMVICSLFGIQKDQCTAEELCSQGWHLCTAKEYQDRGGSSVGPAPTPQAWIKGCLRNGGSYHAPTDILCQPGCVSTTSAPVQGAAWDCLNGIPYSAGGPDVGLMTSYLCYRVGVDQKQTEGFWFYKQVHQKLSAAVCCGP